MPGVRMLTVGLTDHAPVPANLPAVERTLDAITLHLAVRQVGTEVGAIGVDHVSVPRSIAKYHPLVPDALHERRALSRMSLDRPTTYHPSG